ncbi:MAG: carbohydrate ABC transporter permease [Gorillibacterium sp.]|nr:carbohydrate ABC transporter permease [Gorillibacterium sp.]
MVSAIKQSRTDRLFLAWNYLYVTAALVLVAYPVIYIISASISDTQYVSSGEMWLLPKGINFEGYKLVFQNHKIWTGYGNTIIYTLLGTLLNLFVTLPAAYALSRADFYGRRFFMIMFLVTMFFSGGLIPSYLIVKKLHLVNTIGALLLPTAASVYNIIVARTFFESTIPRELQEAAHIDGCTNLKLFTRIVLPLSSPIIAVMALFYGVGQWNSYFPAMIYLNNEAKYPLQLVLRQILVLQQMGSETNGAVLSGEMANAASSKAEIASMVKYAVIIVSTLPIIAVYPFLQKYFVQGVMIGSVKG